MLFRSGAACLGARPGAALLGRARVALPAWARAPGAACLGRARRLGAGAAWARAPGAPGHALGPAMPWVLGAALGSAMPWALGGRRLTAWRRQCTPFLWRRQRRQCTTLLVSVKPLLGRRQPIAWAKGPVNLHLRFTSSLWTLVVQHAR